MPLRSSTISLRDLTLSNDKSVSSLASVIGTRSGLVSAVVVVVMANGVDEGPLLLLLST